MTHHRSSLATASVLLLCACTADTPPAGPRPDGGETDAAPIVATYHEHVRPILAEHCLGCHVAGGIAPFALDSYEAARTLRDPIAAATAERRMPPYPANASGSCNTFVDARWLEESEIAILDAWAEAGGPEGDPTIPAPAIEPPPTLRAGEATHVVDLGIDYVPQESPDDVRCFVVDAGIDAAAGYLTAYQVHPGEPRVVHHVIVFEPESEQAVVDARARDVADDGDGWECDGGSGVPSHPVVIWAPGGGAMRFPAGTGVRMAARPVILQIHYNTATAGALPDHTRVELVLVPSGVQEARILPLSDPAALRLPPRSPDATATASASSPADGRVWGVFPHMHTMARLMRASVARASGGEQCLIDVDRWDFMWQTGYFYEQPIDVLRGETLTVTCTYDTRAATDVVTWGEGTGDEMCLLYFYVTAAVP
jgi:hypothetical protein